MIIIETIQELVSYVEKCKREGLKIGLVPTMGALHPGHLSLVKRSVEDNDITMVSIFVNPTQFNNPDDLRLYPRTLREDCRELAKERVDVVFAPSEKEMYPDGARQEKVYDLGGVAEVMEGKYRPGHFQGVAQIVDRLFQLARPDKAYFGLKDFQQTIVIKNMIKTEGLDVEIVVCPIIREANGLALSSRNVLLSEDERENAAIIHKTLRESCEYAKSHTVEETRKFVVDTINGMENFRVEYFEIVDGETLLPVETWTEAGFVVGCITVFVGSVRLIDNMFYKA